MRKQTSVSNVYIVDSDHPHNFCSPLIEDFVTKKLNTNKNLPQINFLLRLVILGAGEKESREAREILAWWVDDKNKTLNRLAAPYCSLITNGKLAMPKLSPDSRNARLAYCFKETRLMKAAGNAKHTLKTKV